MNQRIALATILATTLTIPVTAATSGSGVVIITQNDVTKGSIPGTTGASGFPVTITSPGSYRLGSDLNVPGGVDGIDINVADVTLDLNGFAVRGPVTCSGKAKNLTCTGFSSPLADGIFGLKGNVTVRNGTVRGFSYGGVFLEGENSVIDAIHASENMGVGIFISNGLITNCTAARNGATGGLFAGPGISANASQVRGNTSTGNFFDGFELSNSSAVDDVAVGNGLFGFDGANSLISNSVSAGNFGDFRDQGGLTSAHTNSCSGSSC